MFFKHTLVGRKKKTFSQILHKFLRFPWRVLKFPHKSFMWLCQIFLLHFSSFHGFIFSFHVLSWRRVWPATNKKKEKNKEKDEKWRMLQCKKWQKITQKK